MKKYRKKTKGIIAHQIDMESDKGKLFLFDNMEQCHYILIHRFGDKYASIQFFNDTQTYTHGDYLVVKNYGWRGMKKDEFEKKWEATE